MGAVSFSIDLKLVNLCQEALSLSTFVETGTFEGDSLEKVKNLFSEIHSIELSASYYQKVLERFKNDTKINLYHGSSDQWLKQLQPQLKDQATLYWLDAHWCVADDTAGDESQCPLLAELTVIETLNSQSIIIIDDARLFLCPPPAPHKINQWPSLDQIIRKLYSLSSFHALMVINDVIIFYPTAIEKQIRDYAYFNGIDWLVELHKSRQYDQILRECEEKEQQIQLLASAAAERLNVIEALAQELQQYKTKS